MNIIVNFMDGTEYWQKKVCSSAERASKVLSDPLFLDRVRAIQPPLYFTPDSPWQVADKLERAGNVKINVGFYRGWFWSRAIAYEDETGVYFNTRKDAQGAGGVNNVAHECMHVLGWSHNGNSPGGNERTVPYLIGDMVEEFCKGEK